MRKGVPKFSKISKFQAENRVYDHRREQENFDLGRTEIQSPIYTPKPIPEDAFIFQWSLKDQYSLEYMLYHEFMNTKTNVRKLQKKINAKTMIMPKDSEAKPYMDYYASKGIIINKTMAKSIKLADSIVRETMRFKGNDYKDCSIIYGYLFDYILQPQEYMIMESSSVIWDNICNTIHRRFDEFRTIIRYQINYEYTNPTVYTGILPIGIPMIRVFVANKSIKRRNVYISNSLFAYKEKMADSMRNIFHMYGINYLNGLVVNELMIDNNVDLSF